MRGRGAGGARAEPGGLQPWRPGRGSSSALGVPTPGRLRGRRCTGQCLGPQPPPPSHRALLCLARSAKTPLANFATGITILITILWITPGERRPPNDLQLAPLRLRVPARLPAPPAPSHPPPRDANKQLLSNYSPAAVFKNMSQNVQGAIIIVGVLQLFDW